MGTAVTSEWLDAPPAGGAARTWLVAFPHAGASAHVYARWRRRLTPAIGLSTVQLPGRGRRLGDAALPDLRSTARAVAAAVADVADAPVALFGHSFGGVLAYQTAVELEQVHGVVPRLLIVASARCPTRPAEVSDIRRLDDDAFAAVVEGIGGIPAEVWHHAEARAMLLPALRDDFVALDEYSAAGNPPLAGNVALLLSANDEVFEPAVGDWSALTGRPCAVSRFAGGHFFVRDEEPAVLSELVRLLG